MKPAPPVRRTRRGAAINLYCRSMPPGLARGPLDRAIGERLRALRLARGLRREALGRPHVGAAEVALIEGGRRAASVAELALFALRLDLPLHDVLWEIGLDGVTGGRPAIFYSGEPGAPSPNHTEIGVVALIVRSDRILLELRADSSSWGLLGGGVRIGESFEAALRREVREESGLAIGRLRFFGTVTDPRMVARYRSGSVARVITVAYRAAARAAGPLAISAESLALGWFSRTGLRGLPIVAPHRPLLAAFARGSSGPMLA